MTGVQTCALPIYREKKTITIPPRWRIHKAETIPFYDAVITFGAKVDKKSFKGDEEIVIANYKHLVKGVSLQFAGRTNGYCFARLIQAYMTEDDLSNHPEFETFKQIQKEIRINKMLVIGYDYAINSSESILSKGNHRLLKWYRFFFMD